MKKEPTRDYVTEMLREYAAAGFPTYEHERDRIYRQAIESCRNSNGEDSVIEAEAAVAEQSAYLADIAAAEAMFKMLEEGNRRIIAKAVRAVYCVLPSRPMRRGDVAGRVSRFALSCPASEAQVYRWLKYARLLCAALRGLSISDHDRRLYRISEKDDSSGFKFHDII